MKKGLLIAAGALALIAVTAFCTVLIIGGGENPSAPPVSVPTSGTTTINANDYWGQRLSELQAGKSTTRATGATTTGENPTTSAKKQTTTTTEQSWFTAYTGSVTAPSWTTTTTNRTTETKATAGKTTRTLTQAERDMVYSGVYDIVMDEYARYRAIQLEYIAELDGKIAEQEAQKQAIDAQYEKDIEALYERFEHEFFPIASAEASLRNTYQNNIASINRTISELKAEKRSAQSALTQSEKELDSVIQAKYYEAIEELQQSTLS